MISRLERKVYPGGIRLSHIFDRDQGICGLCTEPVDPDLPGTDMDCATLDRIIPATDGGAYHPANVRLAHRRCNVARGNCGQFSDLLRYMVYQKLGWGPPLIRRGPYVVDPNRDQTEIETIFWSMANDHAEEHLRRFGIESHTAAAHVSGAEDSDR